MSTKPALGVEALRLRREHRQVLYAWKYDDGKLGVVRTRLLRRGREKECRYCGEQILRHVASLRSFLFVP
jgi:hypothetical protein